MLTRAGRQNQIFTFGVDIRRCKYIYKFKFLFLKFFLVLLESRALLGYIFSNLYQ
jgi:hypothetical protein